EEGEETNTLLKIFSHQNVLVTNLIAILAFIWWGMSLNHNTTSIKWGYTLSLGIIIFTTVVNTIFWLENERSFLTFENGEILDYPIATRVTKIVEPSNELELSSK
ncbi:MAG: hypothetical protein ACW99Q_25145, partial [Candidatus Kariarchaeaceae archaeon]